MTFNNAELKIKLKTNKWKYITIPIFTIKENFKELFLEFAMIFLAITIGFIAENTRGHFTERKSAHQYLVSYRDDLLQNEKQLANCYRNYTIDYATILAWKHLLKPDKYKQTILDSSTNPIKTLTTA